MCSQNDCFFKQILFKAQLGVTTENPWYFYLVVRITEQAGRTQEDHLVQPFVGK